jgi:UPF0148 protein
MEDKKISEAVKLLYKGAKMLSYHCPECGTPIFEYEGKMFCPSCGKEAVFEKDAKEEKPPVEEKSKDPVTEHKLERMTDMLPEEGVDRGEVEKDSIRREKSEKIESEFENLEQALKLKLLDIAHLLENTKSPDEIERLIAISERVISLLDRIRGFK